MERGEEHVHISYLTSMDTWFRAMKVFTVLSLLESIIVLALIRALRAMEKRSLNTANEFDRENLRAKERRMMRLCRRLDYLAQIFSPLMFIIFLIYYVMHVVYGEAINCSANKVDS